jgi:signal transduction histidine kinase
MESERYALERDLHDGAQLHLVSLQMTAAVLEHHLAAGTAADHRLHAALTDLGGKLDRTHRLLADTAEGVAPIPLRNEGLAPALAERFGTAGGVTLLIEPAVRARRYPPTVENAVYFTCLEAVSNAHKHAPGAAITVSLRDTYHGLWFAIEDSGPGLDDSADLGPHHLQARISAVGGSLEVTSSRAAGTRVAGLVPI